MIVLVRQSQGKKHLQMRLLADRSTFAFEDARDAAAMFAGPHSPGGKLALVPGASCGGCPRYDAGLLASVLTAWSWRAHGLSPA